jgi:hypothetical protein
VALGGVAALAMMVGVMATVLPPHRRWHRLHRRWACRVN